MAQPNIVRMNNNVNPSVRPSANKSRMSPLMVIKRLHIQRCEDGSIRRKNSATASQSVTTREACHR